MTGQPQSRVGLIGVGLLGTALAERFLHSGRRVLGFDIDSQRLIDLRSLGGESAESLEGIADACDTIVFSLPDSSIVESVVDQIQSSLRAGTIIIDTTTGDPDRTAAIGERLRQSGVDYVDATVAGSSEQTRRGEAVVMAGGEAEAVQRCEALLKTFSHRVFHVGACGSGARMKLVVNLVLGLNRAVLAEGLSLAAAAGLDAATTLEVLRSGAAYSAAMDAKGQKMIDEDFTPQARLAQHLKDVQLILDLGRQSGASLPLSAAHRELLERAVQLGFGDADNSAIRKAFDK